MQGENGVVLNEVFLRWCDGHPQGTYLVRLHPQTDVRVRYR